ncbi:hypothetical protein C9374_002442 [Naegleria lovaniensis]|uniref:Peptidyl-prolyl cis-trans isomerase n=1 Tax=Naegleria lovaniensis TaxID=51637 RepID=A0AA88GVG4_NAELO|nr:uncharacterized protein C9374_002442 [Naegleria lovaniensis]KAG2386698.1 hypothetical protein C9374_002442 [Naegleria lovaniensis]
MSVLITTSLGEMVVDLWVEECPIACFNFLSLCKIKYYNNCKVFHVEKNAWFQSGDPTHTGKGGHSIFHLIEEKKASDQKQPFLKEKEIYFNDEINVRKKHNLEGLLCMANKEHPNTNASQFYITTTNRHLDYLDGTHTIFGRVEEGIDVVRAIDKLYTEKKGELEVPIQTVRIRHTQILFDPFEEEESLKKQFESFYKYVQMMIPDKSPAAIHDDEIIEIPQQVLNEEGETEEDYETKKEREAKSKAVVLEMIGDLPDAEVAPPENVLFVCKLNPVTTDKSLRLIFSQFGKINKCEVVRNKMTGKSKTYAFIEFESSEACENAYLKMENVIIDDSRIHVDFSQSVAKLWWQNEQEKKQHSSASAPRTTGTLETTTSTVQQHQNERRLGGERRLDARPGNPPSRNYQDQHRDSHSRQGSYNRYQNDREHYNKSHKDRREGESISSDSYHKRKTYDSHYDYNRDYSKKNKR